MEARSTDDSLIFTRPASRSSSVTRVAYAAAARCEPRRLYPRGMNVACVSTTAADLAARLRCDPGLDKSRDKEFRQIRSMAQ